MLKNRLNDTEAKSKLNSSNIYHYSLKHMQIKIVTLCIISEKYHIQINASLIMGYRNIFDKKSIMTLRKCKMVKI